MQELASILARPDTPSLMTSASYHQLLWILTAINLLPIMSALLAKKAFTLTLPMFAPLEIPTAIYLRLMEPDPVQPVTLDTPLLEESVRKILSASPTN
jgi:hypothetical protein